jgi:hypothetical protein
MAHAFLKAKIKMKKPVMTKKAIRQSRFFQENTIDASASISENKGTSIFTNNYYQYSTTPILRIVSLMQSLITIFCLI